MVSSIATRAAHAATRTIPIVGLDYTNDPVAAGYAEEYARPGRNLTGFFLDAPEFATKWLELLNQRLKGTAIVNISRITLPGDNQAKVVEDETKLAADNPAGIGLALFANLSGAATLPAGMDQFNAIAINHPDQGGFGKKAVNIGPMAIEQPEQAGPIR